MFVGAIAGAAAEETNITSYIQSIQTGTITMGNGSSSNTAAITSVNTNNSVIIFGGSGLNAGSADAGFTYLELTNGTTVTATRKVNGTSQPITRYTVVEFTSAALAQSVQAGTITINTATTTGTAAITNVGSNAAVFYLGCSSGSSTSVINDLATVDLTNGTTVTATVSTNQSSTNGGFTLSYMVVDFNSVVVNSVQKISITDATAGTSYTASLSPTINVNNTITLYNGITCNSTALNSVYHRLDMTNGSTLTATRVGTATTSRTIKATVLEFKAAVLNSSVQRGDININGTTTGTAALSSAINTSKSVVTWCGQDSNTTAITTSNTRASLTNGTTAAASRQSGVTAGITNTSFEAIEFI